MDTYFVGNPFLTIKIYTVLNHHSCREQFLWDGPRKLKYLSLSDPYYKLLIHPTYLHIIAGYIANVINFKVVERTQ